MSKKISDYRREAGFATQEQLAMKLGIKRSSVAKWETGRAYPQAKMLTKIAQALNITEGKKMNNKYKDINDYIEDRFIKSKNIERKYSEIIKDYRLKTNDAVREMLRDVEDEILASLCKYLPKCSTNENILPLSCAALYELVERKPLLKLETDNIGNWGNWSKTDIDPTDLFIMLCAVPEKEMSWKKQCKKIEDCIDKGDFLNSSDFVKAKQE